MQECEDKCVCDSVTDFFGGLVPFLPQPLCDLAIPHTTVMEFLDPVMKELLVLGIRGNPECRGSQGCGETEVIIYV